ncbi:MAG: PAS domain S-box protein, partial [Chloroflexota bacterium]
MAAAQPEDHRVPTEAERLRDAIGRVALEIADTLECDDPVPAALRAAEAALLADAIVLWRTDPETRRLLMSHWHLPEKALRPLREIPYEAELPAAAAARAIGFTRYHVTVPVGQGIAGRIAATRKPLVLEELGREEVVSPALKRKARRFTQDDLRLMEVVADRIALAIDRARAEKAVRQSEERFRQLADSMPQLVWTASPDGTVDYYNRRHEEFSGIAREADASWRRVPVVHPDDLQATVEAWQNALRTDATYQITHRVQMADGSYHWYLSRGGAGSRQPGQDRQVVRHGNRHRRPEAGRGGAGRPDPHRLPRPADPPHRHHGAGPDHRKAAGQERAGRRPPSKRQRHHHRRQADEHMIQDLVDLARLEAGQLRLEKVAIDLCDYLVSGAKWGC